MVNTLRPYVQYHRHGCCFPLDGVLYRTIADGSSLRICVKVKNDRNPLAPNDVYISRTADAAFKIFTQQIYLLNILNMLHILRFFFSSRCRLFPNAIFLGSCNIHILNTGCAKILKKIPTPKG